MRSTNLCAEQEFFVGFAQFGVAQQEESCVFLFERARLAKQAHVDFFEQVITFFTIASLTGSHEIFPGALPTTGARYYVIECQFAAMLAAILACFFIA